MENKKLRNQLIALRKITAMIEKEKIIEKMVDPDKLEDRSMYTDEQIVEMYIRGAHSLGDGTIGWKTLETYAKSDKSLTVVETCFKVYNGDRRVIRPKESGVYYATKALEVGEILEHNKETDSYSVESNFKKMFNKYNPNRELDLKEFQEIGEKVNQQKDTLSLRKGKGMKVTE